MRKYGSLLIAATILVLSGLALPCAVYGLPYESETVGPGGESVPTQPVYLPDRKIDLPSGESLLGAEDMALDTEADAVYVADPGNKRIVRLGLASGAFGVISEAGEKDGEARTLMKPTGVALNARYLLVADSGLKEVLIYDKGDLHYIGSISRPSSTLIGTKTPFSPIKVRIDERDNVYVVSEGNTKGVMQLSLGGDFLGYIGANETTASFLDWLQNLLNVNPEGSLLSAGGSVTNIALDDKGLIYTVTYKSRTNAVKKLNTTGVAIMSPAVNYAETTEVFVDHSDNIFSVRSDGYVSILDSYGNLLFSFGGKNKEEILGTLSSPVAAAVKDDGELLVLDKERGFIVAYEPTPFAKLVYKAVDYYRDGLYLEGEESWREVLKYNAKFILAYRALAKANMKRGNYAEALAQYKLAEDKAGYSEAYWEIRDNWLRTNLAWIIIPLIVLVVGVFVVQLVNKKKPAVFAGAKARLHKFATLPLVGDINHLGRYLAHTRDAVYEMKFKGKSNLISATIYYVFFVVIQILRVYIEGYLFNGVDVYGTNGLSFILLSTLPLLLIVCANYFVSTITEGEGKFRQVYIGFIYALAPYLIFAIPMFLISNVLTYNEQVIYQLIEAVIYGWCGVNVILMIMELHDYGFWQAIKNILLTVIAALIAVAFAFILYMLAYQFVSYVISIFREIFT